MDDSRVSNAARTGPVRPNGLGHVTVPVLPLESTWEADVETTGPRQGTSFLAMGSAGNATDAPEH